MLGAISVALVVAGCTGDPTTRAAAADTAGPRRCAGTNAALRLEAIFLSRTGAAPSPCPRTTALPTVPRSTWPSCRPGQSAWSHETGLGPVSRPTSATHEPSAEAQPPAPPGCAASSSSSRSAAPTRHPPP